MYDLLKGIRVLDVSLLAPAMLGMELADLGAEVIKVEAPPHGDHLRAVGGTYNGGPSLLHLRWNRGKRSLALNLKTAEGREIFLELAAKSHVVIEGLRAGAMDRFGVGYPAVREVNPRIVYCAISGVGQTGPYRSLATHGVAFDAFAGLAPVAFREDGLPYIGPHLSVGTRVAAIYAALGVVAALVKAERTGEGSYLDVAEIDAAAFMQADDIVRLLNTGRSRPPTPYKNAVRYQYYRTRDDRYVVFQAYEHKFWEAFCRAIDRPDLLRGDGGSAVRRDNDLDAADGDEELRAELTKIFRTRTQQEWVGFFIQSNVPGAPVHSLDEMLEDPQFQARENVVEHTHPQVGVLKVATTPVKVSGQQYDSCPAPKVGEHTDQILFELLGYDEGRRAQLRQEGAIG